MAISSFLTGPADGSLILPRVNVEWGTVNLTCPSAEGSTLAGIDLTNLGPLVYDVKMSMEDQGQTPSGSMKWNPAAPAYAAYEKCIELFREWSIMMTFYYVTGRSITFEFFWAGQSETYGKEMEITVKLVSLMDGLINANFFATVQADKEEKGKSYKDSLSELEKQFGISGVPFRAPFIRYTKQAEKDLSDAVVKMNYNDGSTFMDAMQNLVKDNGNYVFFNNIESANATVFGPYSYEGSQLAEGETLIKIPPATRKSPDPTIRYAYLIGPHIIQSFTRTLEWQPPQKSQEISSILARKKEEDKERKKRERGRQTSTPSSNQQQTGQTATAPSGVYGDKTTSNISSDKNKIGPIKQDIFTKEKTAKLALTTLMVPALTGIKPLDIIFIPSYSGDYLEDWAVSSVEYQQTQGGVDLAIQATRPYGSGDPMCPNDEEKLKGGAQNAGLMTVPGSEETPTLEIWNAYAWGSQLGIPDDLTPPTSAPAPSQTPTTTPNQRLPGEENLTDEEVAYLDAAEKDYVDSMSAAFPPVDPPSDAITQASTREDGQVVLKSNDRLFHGWATDSGAFGKDAEFNFREQTITAPGLTLEGAQRTYAEWNSTGVGTAPESINTRDKYLRDMGRKARLSGSFLTEAQMDNYNRQFQNR